MRTVLLVLWFIAWSVIIAVGFLAQSATFAWRLGRRMGEDLFNYVSDPSTLPTRDLMGRFRR